MPETPTPDAAKAINFGISAFGLARQLATTLFGRRLFVPGINDRAAADIIKIESTTQFPVPLVVETGTGQNWADAY